jgi:hypothetical protein
MLRPRDAACALVLAVVLAACDRRLEPYVPPEAEPPRVERPLRVPGFESPAPQASQRVAEAPTSPAGPSIRGTLRLAEGATPAGGSVLFVIARPAAGGPPLAVKRLQAGPFPLEFEIGPADAMIAGQPFAGPIALSARVDADGDPLTREAQDLVAQSAEPLAPGARDVELVLRASGG